MKKLITALLLATTIFTLTTNVYAKEQSIVVENHIEEAYGIIVDVDVDNHVALVEIDGEYYEIFADDFFAGDLVKAYVDRKNTTTTKDDIICNCVYVGYLW